MADTQIAFHLRESAGDVASLAARKVLAAADQAIAARGRFLLVLAGGRTPLTAYTLLARQGADWDRWHIFFGDERCLPADDGGRNSVAAAAALTDRVPIPVANVHPIAAELGPEVAARLYEEVVGPRLPFDLVLLGMGEDGHTASLFPGRTIPEGPLVVPVRDAPKPPPERVSLTPRALSSSRGLLILVTGAEKRQALSQWRSGADLPVSVVARAASTEVLVDREAAGTATDD